MTLSFKTLVVSTALFGSLYSHPARAALWFDDGGVMGTDGGALAFYGPRVKELWDADFVARVLRKAETGMSSDINRCNGIARTIEKQGVVAAASAASHSFGDKNSVINEAMIQAWVEAFPGAQGVHKAYADAQEKWREKKLQAALTLRPLADKMERGLLRTQPLCKELRGRLPAPATGARGAELNETCSALEKDLLTIQPHLWTFKALGFAALEASLPDSVAAFEKARDALKAETEKYFEGLDNLSCSAGKEEGKLFGTSFADSKKIFTTAFDAFSQAVPAHLTELSALATSVASAKKRYDEIGAQMKDLILRRLQARVALIEERMALVKVASGVFDGQLILLLRAPAQYSIRGLTAAQEASAQALRTLLIQSGLRALRQGHFQPLAPDKNDASTERGMLAYPFEVSVDIGPGRSIEIGLPLNDSAQPMRQAFRPQVESYNYSFEGDVDHPRLVEHLALSLTQTTPYTDNRVRYSATAHSNGVLEVRSTLEAKTARLQIQGGALDFE